MATFKNPANDRPGLSVLAQGVVAHEKFEFDLAAGYADGHSALNSEIVLGYVPADCKLIPHLCRITFPKMDGADTARIKIGYTDGAEDGLVAQLSGLNAASKDVVGGTFKASADVGSTKEPVAIIAKMSTAAATAQTTGKIVVELAYRAFNPFTD